MNKSHHEKRLESGPGHKRCIKCHGNDAVGGVCGPCLDRTRNYHEQFEDDWEIQAEDEGRVDRDKILKLYELGIAARTIGGLLNITFESANWVIIRGIETGLVKQTKSKGYQNAAVLLRSLDDAAGSNKSPKLRGLNKTRRNQSRSQRNPARSASSTTSA